MSQSQGLLPEIGVDVGAELAAGVVSRRNFVKITGVTGAGVFAGSLFGSVPFVSALTSKTPIMSDSKGVLLQDMTRCVACRRCELACTEFNDGAASSFLSRVKVGRNFANMPGAPAGTAEGKGGDFRVQADTCKQCPHPVPCAEACPKGAIKADAKTGARKVDTKLCVGCGICTKACPWAVITVNPETHKSSKCYLCDGNPECARACPTGAMKYVAWRDLRLSTLPVQAGIMANPSTDPYCSPCHS
jgi:Fe-S-cluster-containing dehydrogenase component